LGFYENSFSFKCRFLHESGDYGELETGNMVLVFASYERGKFNLPNGYISTGESKEKPWRQGFLYSLSS